MKLTLEQQQVFVDLQDEFMGELSIESGDLVDLIFDDEKEELELDDTYEAILRQSLSTLLELDEQRELELDDYERSISEEILRS